MHVSIPEVASLPVKPTVSAWLYQPLESGGRDGLAPVTCGAVASYMSANARTVVLPATSRQEPLTERLGPSGPEYVCAGTQDSTPEVASVPVKLTLSEWLYQPFESGARAGVAVTCGPVAS